MATFTIPTYAQITYFEQDFNGSGLYENPNPGTGQFTSFIENMPTVSYFSFQNGAMEMIRTQPTGAGRIIANRSTPFSPNPETLYIQVMLTVKGPATYANPAGYIYVGENMSTTTFPSNNSVFAHASIAMDENGFTIGDTWTDKRSGVFALNTPVEVTLVLNNSQSSVPYKMPETATVANYSVAPQKYDIWVSGLRIVTNGQYSAPSYSATKLSAFQIRFYNGVGTLSIDNIRIRDIDGVLPVRFKSFTAQLVEKDAELFWEAEESEDFHRFIVQRSRDNILFESVGEVAIPSNSDGEYRFRDTSVPLGISYYRVVQSDNKGQEVAQSMVRDVVNNSSEKSAGIWPNPSDGSVIHVVNISESASDLKLLNFQGSEIKMDMKRLDKNRVDLTPGSHLLPGLYLLTYMDEGKHKTLKFMVGDLR